MDKILQLFKSLHKILLSKTFQRFIAFLVLVDILAIILESYDTQGKYALVATLIAVFSALFFTLEYVVRIIEAPKMNTQKSKLRSRFSYIFSFTGIIDFIAILPFTLTYLFQGRLFVNIINLSRILLIFKLLRYSKSFGMITEVFRSIRSQLLTSMTAVGITLCFSAILMYYIEREAQPEVFNNIGQGFWWAIVTFTTVGYGDIYPITPFGKLLAGMMSIFGIIMLTLPTGIFSGALMSQMQKEKYLAKSEHLNVNNENISFKNNDKCEKHKCPHCGKELKKRLDVK